MNDALLPTLMIPKNNQKWTKKELKGSKKNKKNQKQPKRPKRSQKEPKCDFASVTDKEPKRANRNQKEPKSSTGKMKRSIWWTG